MDTQELILEQLIVIRRLLESLVDPNERKARAAGNYFVRLDVDPVLAGLGVFVEYGFTTPTTTKKQSVPVWKVGCEKPAKGIHAAIKLMPRAQWYGNRWCFYFDPRENLLEVLRPLSDQDAAPESQGHGLQDPPAAG